MAEVETAEVRWLSEEELGTWVSLVTTMMRLPALLDRQLQRDSGINHFDYGILSTLSEAPDRTVQMSSLARFTNGSLSRLSHALRRHEDRGWVERFACPTDGRLTEARLTDAGWIKVREASVGHVDLVRRMVCDPLSADDLRTLGRLSATIAAQLDGEPG